MSRESRKFNVPDELANLYDFTNSLDVRHFTYHGVQHEQDDELKGSRELAAWMTERELLRAGTRITPEAFATALRLRTDLRAYLQCAPSERRKNRRVTGALNEALKPFPLVVETGSAGRLTLQSARDDALAGLSVVVAEFYNGAADGTLDRLKMCAAEECRRVFFDRSKPATRRWCMSTLCGNRMKTRAYRERRRAAG